jgi:hypothetical protein
MVYFSHLRKYFMFRKGVEESRRFTNVLRCQNVRGVIPIFVLGKGVRKSV